MGDTSFKRARTRQRGRRAATATVAALGVLALGAGPALATTPGDLDRSFGHHGSVSTDLGGVDVAHDVVVQPDGKIVVAGTSSGDIAVARYTRKGRLDHSFGRNGTVVTDLGTDEDSGDSVALGADGSIVVAGSAVVRYTSAGRLDSTFGDHGVVALPAHDVLVQANGKIVLVGGSHLRRLKRSGVLDPRFKQPYDYVEGSRLVVRQSSGSYVLAAGTDDAATVLTRYTPDGDRDDSFRSNSLAGGPLGILPVGLFTLQDDKVLAVSEGVYYRAPYVPGRGDDEGRDGGPAISFERFLSDGRRDPSFGVGGERVYELRRFPAGLRANPVASTVTSDGRIVVVGPSYVARFRPGGKLDRSFGADGVVRLRGLDAALATAAQPNGKIVVAGQSQDDFAVQRLLGR